MRLCPARDAPALAAALAEALADPQGAAERGARARADYARRFTPEAVAAQMLTVHRDVLPPRR